jgi:hypothetical protein
MPNSKSTRRKAEIFIWPRVVYNGANDRFLREDNPSIIEALNEDPSLWGFSIRFRQTARNKCIPTNKMNWYVLNEQGWPAMQTPTDASGKQAMAFLECVQNSEGHEFSADFALRWRPDVDELEPFEQKNSETMVATYTRVGFLMHDLSYKNSSHLKPFFTEREVDYTPDDHHRIMKSRAQHFGASCLTLMLGETPKSNHAQLQYEGRVHEVMQQHLKHLGVMSQKVKFSIHPEWTLPEDDN